MNREPILCNGLHIAFIIWIHINIFIIISWDEFMIYFCDIFKISHNWTIFCDMEVLKIFFNLHCDILFWADSKLWVLHANNHTIMKIRSDKCNIKNRLNYICLDLKNCRSKHLNLNILKICKWCIIYINRVFKFVLIWKTY